jgi:hypothetical protein
VSIKTKSSISLEDVVSIIVGVAVFVLALSITSWIGWFLVYPYTVFVVLAAIGLFIGGMLKILHTPNALPISFIGTSISYVLLNIYRVFIEIDSPWLARVAVVALIGFTSAVALVKVVSDKRNIPLLTAILFIIATFSLDFLARINGYIFHL